MGQNMLHEPLATISRVTGCLIKGERNRGFMVIDLEQERWQDYKVEHQCLNGQFLGCASWWSAYDH